MKIYEEIKPKKKPIKKIYVAAMLWFVGRAIQAAAKTDKNVKEEFKNLRDDFAFSLGVVPNGPVMIVGKTKEGKVKYQGWSKKGQKLTLEMNIKNIEAAMLVFTFQESTSVAFARNRFFVTGDLPDALAVVRILDLVEVYLLPKIITKLAVKRYPKWSELNPIKKYVNRIIIYVRTILGV